MSQRGGNSKSLAGWTMVDSKGEVVSDDGKSDSSDSPPHVAGLTDNNCTQATTLEAGDQLDVLPLSEEGKLNGVVRYVTMTSSKSPTNQHVEHLQFLSEPSDVEHFTESPRDSTTDDCPPSSGNVVETDGGVGACCLELLNSEVANQSDGNGENDKCAVEEGGGMMGSKSSQSLGLDEDLAIPGQKFGDELEDDLSEQGENSDDSDSDFVQINDENFGEYEVELERNRREIQDRSPSIPQDFNFLGHADGYGDELGRNHQEIPSDDEEYNEDTESSTEDITDDRIESDQSDVGTINTLTDVGDLSAFADIGDLPLEAGNVARNYRHRPNNWLSTVLNLTLVVVTILTMGISIGLIMATDLEIEEWQTAYRVQVKKLSSLEWTLTDLNRLLKDSKDKVDGFESVLKTFSKLENSNDNSNQFFISVAEIVNNFNSCHKRQGGKSTLDCHALIRPDLQHALFLLTGLPQTNSDLEDGSSYLTVERNVQHRESPAKIMSRQEPPTYPAHKHEIHDLQQSLSREQERALHWQNLYLMERRQREWERENEDLEDKRERAQWEMEDEEEDKLERQKWEKEEEESDRKERLLWEQKDKEEDQRDRERWEEERAQLDSVECLKKLMSTDLAFLKQNILKWNATAFSDFVNVSTLMSGIAEMKQSMVTSMQQIWNEAEEALKKMGEDIKSGKKPYLDTSIMADYLRQSLAMLRSQFDNVMQDQENMDDVGTAHKSYDETLDKKSEEKIRTEPRVKVSDGATKKKEKSGKWNRAVGKVFRNVSKSLRKLMRTLTSSWITAGDKKSSQFTNSEQTGEAELVQLFPPWVPGKSCHSLWSRTSGNKRSIMVGMESSCLWDLRDGLSQLVLEKTCGSEKRYSHACNADTNAAFSLKQDLKRVLKTEDRLRIGKVDQDKAANMQQLLSEFVGTWGNSELLLKADKAWTMCQLQVWSEFSRRGDVKACSRSVQLVAVLKDVEDRNIHGNGDSSSEEDNIQQNRRGVDLSKTGGEMKHEEQHIDNTYAHQYDDVDVIDVGDHDYDDVDENVSNDDDNMKSIVNMKEHSSDDDDIHDYNTVTSDSHLLDAKTSAESQKGNYSNVDDEISGDEDDHYREMAWYLKRAQYRIEMRREQEKAEWIFDMSEHRDEMRKKQNTVKKSVQWLFDQAADREAQRKKDHQSDWMFDRAQQRREDLARKWSHKPQPDCDERRKSFHANGRMKKMKDLTKSEWLVQKQAARGAGYTDDNPEMSKKHSNRDLGSGNEKKGNNHGKKKQRKHHHADKKSTQNKKGQKLR